MSEPLRVLVVDDDPDIRYIAELALARIGGFDVAVAGSGPEALAALDAAPRLPSCVLLDMTMPGMTGAETAREIAARPRLAGLPIVFLTGRLGAGDIAGYAALGAVGVIEKPFDPLDLARRVRACLDADGHAPDGT